MRDHRPSPSARDLEIEKEASRLGAQEDRVQSAETTSRTRHASPTLERAEVLGHRLDSIAGSVSSEASGNDAVQREMEEDDEKPKTLQKAQSEAPSPRLKLEDYLDRRRSGRHDA